MKLIDRLPKRPWARIFLVVATLLLAWTLLATAWRFVLAPRLAAQNKAEAVAKEETTKGTSDAAQQALTVTNEVHREYVRTDEITRRTENVVKSSADAGTRLPGVAASLRDSLCEYRAYSGDPGCTAVLGNDRGVGPARDNPWRAPPGK